MPLWIALWDRFVGHQAQALRVVVGLALGFAGTALLVDDARLGGVPLSGLLLAVAASMSWAGGSLVARAARLPHRPFVGNAMVMIAGGALSLLLGVARGELALVRPDRFSAASSLALGIVFGSWIAFSAYLWLLRNARTSLVATYAWVTPMLAVYLGHLFVDEPLRGRSLVAGAVVLAAVALTVSAGGVARETSDAREERRAEDEAEVPLSPARRERSDRDGHPLRGQSRSARIRGSRGSWRKSNASSMSLARRSRSVIAGRSNTVSMSRRTEENS